MKYVPISRTTIAEKCIPDLVGKVKMHICEILKKHSSISVTVDIWSDRTLRSFLGVTAHVCNTSEDVYKLDSFLLDCRHFPSRHTGENISMAFDDITEEYTIASKIDYTMTDNAANMKCAFKVKLPQQSVDPSDDNEEETDNLDDEELWEDLDNHQETLLDMTRSRQRLSCFAHSLQLVIGDGLKEAKFISLAIAKASKLTSLLHSSTTFKNRFEATFGSGKSIPVANVTCWNSTFKQVQAITSLDYKNLAEICGKEFENVVFTLREWNQLQELSAILGPFSEATDLTQGEKSVTISMVVPTVLDLNTHLLKMGETRSQCQPLIKALHNSLQRRFSGIFVKAKMARECEAPMPFHQDVYFLSAMLDPQFGLNWIDLDVSNSDASSLKMFREDVKRTLTKSVADGEATQQMNADDSSSSNNSPPPTKLPRLVVHYKAHKSQRNLTVDASISDQISKYFSDIQDPCSDSALVFWSKNKDRYPQLHALAVKLLSVPASSAPVERIFSRGGLIMRPHHARLGSRMVSSLIFLKSNYAHL
ncbi:hypothetical protein ABG768_016000 [Culter alburnus]|uniref:HAT C-terminal dimerisation domain-containing protein n=1 Tax=Culter alburnus TaxID=194366 RepID=A0AAW1YXR0_CULAL